MKKLFTLFTLLILMSMVVHGQIVQFASSMQVNYTNNGQVGNVDWYCIQYHNEAVGATSTLHFVIPTGSAKYYNGVYAPPEGMYPIWYDNTDAALGQVSIHSGYLIGYIGSAGTIKSVYTAGYTDWYLKSGNVYIETGSDGKPYIEINAIDSDNEPVYIVCGTPKSIDVSYTNAEANGDQGFLNTDISGADIFRKQYARGGNALPLARFDFVLARSGNTQTYANSVVGPNVGTYSAYITDSKPTSSQIGKFVGFYSGGYMTLYQDEYLRGYFFIDNGTNITVAKGTDGPYMKITGTANNGYATRTISITVGTRAYAITLNNQSATTEGTTEVLAVYNANTNLTSAITRPTKSGYDFDGYYTSASGGTQFINANGNFNANVTYNSQQYLDDSRRWKQQKDITLYAHWTYNITYKDQGNVTYSGNNSGSLIAKHTYGTSTTLVNGAKDGYIFGGWYDNSSCTGNPVTTLGAYSSGPVTLYAKWTQNVYHLDLTSGGNGTVSRSDNGTSSTDLHAGDEITLSYTPSDGYGFVNWTGTGSAYVSDNVFTVPNINGTTFTLQANFGALHTITVSADPVAGGTVSGGGTYGEGANVTLTATPNSGYSFSCWSDGNTSNPRNVTMGNTDATYTAEFLQQIHDFEYRFTWTADNYTGTNGTGQVADGGSNNSNRDNYYYVLRTKMVKDYVTQSNASAYPAITIDIITTKASSGQYMTCNSKRLPVAKTYTNTTTSLKRGNAGKIVTNASNDSYYTKFFASDGTAYRFSTGKVQYIGGSSNTYPFVYVEGTFNNNSTNKTVFATIGVAPTYTITLNSQRSGVNATTSGTPSVTATYTYNTYTPNPIVTPTLTGYTFGGYWTGNGGTGTQIIDADGNFIADVDGYTDALKRWFYENNITLYAKWMAKTYTVNLDNQEATTAGTESVTATYNAAMPSATMPTKTGYAFNGYYTSTNGGGTQYYTAAGASARNWNIDTNPSTLYAYWTQKSYTLAVSVAGTDAGASVTRSDGGGNATVKRYDDAITLTPVESTGYHFTGWTGTDAGDLVDNNNGTYTLTIADKDDNYPYAVTANFAANTNTAYTVKHYQQNLTLDGYTEVVDDRQNLTGTTATATAAEANTYIGFMAQSFNQETIAADGSTEVSIYYNRDKYTVTVVKNENAYGTLSGESENIVTVTNVPYGTVITTGTGENANKVTINKTVVTANPVATTAEYTYTFNNWINGTATVTGSGLTVTANFTRTTNTYDIVWKSEDGTSTLETDEAQAYGTATAYNGATTPTKTVTGYTYTFDGWATSANGEKAYNNGETPTVSGAATYYAHFTGERDNYTITYNGLEGATNSNNPTSYNVETPTITLQDPGTRDGYIFAGWKDESNNTITQIAKGSTGNRTLTATWNVKSSNIELCENCNDAHYNAFKTNYNGETVNVTYKRQFAEGRWSTMCLPFSLDLATMIANKMNGRVYEFKYATGNANVGSGVNLYFSNAKSIEAGKCYIVNANAELADKTSFVFIGVTIDLSKDNGAALDSKDDYDDLWGYNSQGTIELVGTLRNGTLKGVSKDSQEGNTYMGLKSNKIYYPNTGTGSTIWAYRGIFRSSEFLDKESMQKMRIVVDGEDRGELIIDADGDILAPSDAQSRKFIRDGVLYIEREGVIYDAQGKRVEGM